MPTGEEADGDGLPLSHRSHGRHEGHDSLIAQVSAWIKQEKAKRAARKSKNQRQDASATGSEDASFFVGATSAQMDGPAVSAPRRSSEGSEDSTALDGLQDILNRHLNLVSTERHPTRKESTLPSRISFIRKLRRQSTAGSSDTDYQDGEPLVPSCDAILDNSKTLAYSGGATGSEQGTATPGRSTPKEKEAWAMFKFEIVRLTHTLRLKGWRRIPMERSSEIDVERLSGALTNAVYVVSPPKELPASSPGRGESNSALRPRKPPPKLLLRIYGPQVEHLIDREAELQILRRLARKRIGPRLLGTFTNGRFEEFFYARPLTPHDLRVPDTSKQIAKRMRELHEGIDLLPQEREDGAFVWRNWDKWVDRCERIISWLDAQVLAGRVEALGKAEAWKERGLVCGVEWPVFRRTVERYREWLDEQYGGPERVRDELVFAHNDTQYGNILRLVPPGESPLLLPANEHKQLVVIDFEYANANTPGLEFANHFTEWCYNYHDPTASYICNTTVYPTPEEQRRFIRSYVQHHPFAHPSTSSAPQTPGLPSTSIPQFTLDSRASARPDAMRDAEAATEKQVRDLMATTRLWRPANSAQWVAWGVVQATIPGLPDVEHHGEEPGVVSWELKKMGSSQQQAQQPMTDPLDDEARELKEEMRDRRPEEGDEGEGFDYLAYARERAMFFWGDMVVLGIVGVEELPEEVRGAIKLVDC